MYQVDDADIVRELTDIPRMDRGAPCPLILVDQHTTVVTYYERQHSPEWKPLDSNVIVQFVQCMASIFGPPNDEAFEGHPLASRGLDSYRAFLVENSSWLRSLERMNSVHPHHRPEDFCVYNHYVIGFHDSTFECIAKSYRFEIREGYQFDLIPRMKDLLSGAMASEERCGIQSQ